MPSYNQYKRQVAVLDADNSEIESWITVRGNHIPIKKGQSKEEAVKSFIEGKKKNLVENHNSLVEAMNLEEKGYFNKDPKKRDSITQSAIEMGKEEKNLEELMEFGVKEANSAKLESKPESNKEDYPDKKYHEWRSQLKEEFKDYPKFEIRDNFAVAENDKKRVVLEKFGDKVDVTIETAEGDLIENKEFDIEYLNHAAKYAEQQRAKHHIKSEAGVVPAPKTDKISQPKDIMNWKFNDVMKLPVSDPRVHEYIAKNNGLKVSTVSTIAEGFGSTEDLYFEIDRISDRKGYGWDKIKSSGDSADTKKRWSADWKKK